jgi:hypothetical protein
MVTGSCLAFLVLRALIVGHITSVWMVINDFLISSVAMYLFYRGVLAVRGINYSQRAGPRFGWGRVLIGSALVFSNAYNYRHATPTPEFLQPSNETQAVAMKTTETALLCGAVGLIIWGIAWVCDRGRIHKMQQPPSFPILRKLNVPPKASNSMTNSPPPQLRGSPAWVWAWVWAWV